MRSEPLNKASNWTIVTWAVGFGLPLNAVFEGRSSMGRHNAHEFTRVDTARAMARSGGPLNSVLDGRGRANRERRR